MSDKISINEYLQKTVMGECWHTINGKSGGRLWIKQPPPCDTCGKNLMNVRLKYRNFFTPTDYCALEDRLTELGEWGYLIQWLVNELHSHSVLVAWNRWCTTSHTQRVKLIAKYFRRKR